MEGFVACPKNDGRRGTLAEDLQRCIFRGRRSTRDREGLHFGGSDLQFWEDDFKFCVTGSALRTTWHHFFVARAVL